MNKLKYLIITLFVTSSAYAQVRGSSITADTQNFKDSFSEWGTVATGTAFLISLTIAVLSLLIPWQFLKQTLGRAAWTSVATSLLLFIVMSFFGNSINKSISSLLSCGLSIFNQSCN